MHPHKHIPEGWLQCFFCKKFDDPKNLSVNKRHIYHKKCAREYDNERKYNIYLASKYLSSD